VSIRTAADRPTPLPILVRPQQGESVESYIRRLARANHLRPSYLHGYLCSPPYYLGTVQPERLAIVSNRTLNALTRAVPSLTATPTPRGAQPTNRRPTAQQRRQERTDLFAAIRRDAAKGLSLRALATHYRVHRRTVAQALTNAAPPPRKSVPRRGTRLDYLDAYIDELLKAEPNPVTQRVWERLTDEHDVEVSCSTVRNYIAGRHRNRHKENHNPGPIG
jgi:hypothetical protein